MQKTRDMIIMKTAWLLFVMLALPLPALLSTARAQDSGSLRPIRLVMGSPAGSGSDVFARKMLPKLSAMLNATVIVENKIGANGSIAVDFVAKSKPDGYTLMLNTLSVVLSVAMGEKLPYDLLNDLVPVARLAGGGQWLVVHAGVLADTPAQFITHLKANPGKLNYGSAGNGNIMHLVALLFLQNNGLSAIHVPYKGGSFAMIDLVAGRTQFAMPDTALVLPLAKDKRVKVLANTSLTRSPLLPDVPTLNETVMPGVGIANFWGVMAPAQTPPAILKRLNETFVKIVQDPDMKAQMSQEGLDLAGSSAEEYGTLIKTEMERWTKVIKSAGIKPD